MPPYVKGSDTSKAAAESMESSLTELQEKLLLRMRDVGARGVTCDELEEYFVGSNHQTISPRVRELYLGGWIYRTKRRRKTRSGRMAMVYRVRRRRRANVACVCDKPTCSRWPCKLLREYRITHRVVSEIVRRTDEGDVDKLLSFIETECEILVK